MNVRAVVTTVLVAGAVFAGVLAGASARAAFATTDDRVLHLIVEHTSDLDPQPRVIEYWLDEQRNLAKSVEITSVGTHTNATGPNWFIQVPPRGRAQYVATLAASGSALSVWASLYYLRDATAAGATAVVARDQHAIVVRLGRRTGAFEAATGLPLWDSENGTRTNYAYRTREQLPASAFPMSFFSDTLGRDLTATHETTRELARRMVTFAAHRVPQLLVDRPLEKTLVTYNPSELTREQITYVYRDITVTVSLLAVEPTSVRPGGKAFVSAIGSGWLFDTADRAQLMVIDGLIATNVHAPDADLVLAASEALAASR